ncbi:stress-activated map kinase-interacting protein 1 [Ischnura elegans]|uniref:stress-activated map kinase-interacting protein 1 n=1 Tax=Ischnura elegans TaxID=197161 RepID=UPI001ED87489|nr:stress-activated map kinase-interacting protein 1 [Ischnura elegans]
MALYDNKHWLLSHIQNSFVSSDNTGICEMVMLGEEIPKKLANLSKLDCYPGMKEDSDDGDDMDLLAQSFELQSELGFGGHRLRSNTAQRLEQLDKERRKAAKVRHVKWEYNPNISEEDREDMFTRKELPKKAENVILNKSVPKVRKSLLSEQLEKSPALPQSPFVEFAKYDGSAQVGMAVRQYRIFITMASPSERDYPLEVSVLATAKVRDLVGLVCWKYASEHKGATSLLPKVDRYGLYIAEDDGEVDWDFPCLDRGEIVAKFGFRHLALVERSEAEVEKEEAEEKERMKRKSEGGGKNPQNPSSLGPLPRGDLPNSPFSRDHESKMKADEEEDQQRMRGHMTALEAPLYQSFRVLVLGRMRVRTEVHLGISGEKIEVDPIGQQRLGSRFWSLRRSRMSSSSSPSSSSVPSATTSSTSASICHVATAIAACDLTDKHSRYSTFRLVLKVDGPPVPRFKRYDFEADHETAEQVVRKVNHILELHSSSARKEYHALREKKAQKRRTSTFHLGPR